MTHQMNLWNNSFQSIKKGTKSVELRLNDEKRKEMNKGDLITFTNTFTKQMMTCAILDKFEYASFEELYPNYTPIELGYQADEVADPKDMLEYYTKEDIEKYGVVAMIICPLEHLTPAMLVDHEICPTCFDKANNHCLYGDDQDKMIVANDQYECFLVGNPRAQGHMLISSSKHYKNMMEIPNDLCKEIFVFAKKAMKVMKEVYRCESVYLCTMCDGPMNHFHIQLIPRYASEKRGAINFTKPRKDYTYQFDKVNKLRKLLNN